MNTLLVLTLFCGLVPAVFSAAVIDNPLSAAQYLMYFNYVKQSDMDNGKLMTEEVMSNGLKMFQSFANITVTGEFDTETMEKMNQPRCGVPDMMNVGADARKRRFAAQAQWPTRSLTWRVDNVTPDFGTPAAIVQLMKDALQYWSDVSGLTFTQVTSTNADADIIISFAPFAHGDGNPFDGPGGTLAHAYFPGSGIGGDAHFDESETYSAAGGGINLFQVAVHEFGHSLGLGHSEVDAAVMAPFYTGYDPNFALHPDDIAGIQTLYGTNVGVPEVTMRPETMPPNVPCTGQFDTITRTADGSTYAFKDNLVFKLDSDSIGLEPGFPAEISSVFPGLPNNLDASVFWDDVSKTYFFKGDQYYRVGGTTLDAGYPKPISLWNGLPNDLDAGFVWSGNGRVYFIKGDQYYRYNRYSGRVDGGYPRPLSVWRGLPSSIDSAMQWSNSRTYFFSGEEYYRFNDRSFRIDSSYPVVPYNTGLVAGWIPSK
uniref:Matrix metalloproteinase 16 n=1 Tax=Stichopus japonicus TaxID=307972 RepID=A0A2P9J4V1_STIJA|nr:matrix metalloproteinase 16 [Apostichopus japonicus]